MQRLAFLVVLACAFCFVNSRGVCKAALAGPAARLRARFVEAEGQRESRVWCCPRAAGPVAVDGVLEDAWQAATPLQLERYEGPPAFEPTTVRVLHDDTYLYISFDARESNMRNLKQKAQTKRDVYGANDVEIFLRNTARKDQQFQFIANTDGVKWDGNSTQGKQWEPKWLRQGKRGKDGYVIEVAIPWAELDKADPNKKILKNQPKSHDRLWRINLCRNDHTAGAAVPSRSSLDGRWGASESAVRLFLGTPQEYIDKISRHAVVSGDLFIDRREVRDHDALQALLNIDPGPRLLQNLKAVISLSKKGAGKPGELARQTINPLRTRSLAIDIVTDDLDPGEYEIEAQVVGTKDARKPTTIRRTFARVGPWEAEQARRTVHVDRPVHRIPLVLHSHSVKGETSWPISTGIPFPKGALLDSTKLRLVQEDGTSVLAQFTPRATWSRGGSLKWVGLDFVAAYRDGVPHKYSVEFGPDVNRPALKGGLVVKETAQEIVIQRGEERFSFSKQQTPERATHPDAYIVDHNGAAFSLWRDTKRRVELEERGPVRAVVRVEGDFISAKGKPLCRAVTRMFFYVGKPFVRYQHTIVVTCDTNKVQFRDMGFRIPVEDVSDVRFGADGETLSLTAGKGESLSLLQAAEKEFLLRRFAGGKGEVLSEGKAAAGWVQGLTGKRAVTVVLKDFVELFPKELEADRNGFTIHFWPAHGITRKRPLTKKNIMQFWFCHQGDLLDFRFPKVDRDLLDSWNAEDMPTKPDFYAQDRAAKSSAEGIGIMNEFLVSTRPAKQAEQGIADARMFQQDPHGLPDPAWLCGTEVFGKMHHKDPEGHPETEASIQLPARAAARVEDARHNKGMFNYGDVRCSTSFYPARDNWGLRRHWNAMHYNFPMMLWLNYARSADPFWWRLCRATTRHMMSIDTVQCDTGNGKPAGAQYHCKGWVHWASDYGIGGHLSDLDYLVQAWYLGGDRRALDMFRRWLKSVKHPKKGILDRRWHGTDYAACREGTGTFCAILLAYQETWDPALIPSIDAWADSAFREPLGKYLWPDYSPFIARWMDFSNSPEARQRLLEWKGMGRSYSLYPRMIPLAYQWFLTGDAHYLERARAVIQGKRMTMFQSPGHEFDGAFLSPCWMAHVYHAQQAPYMMKVFARAGVKVTEAPPKQQEAGYISTGVYVTENNPAMIVAYAKEPEDREFSISVRGCPGHPGAISNWWGKNWKVKAYRPGGEAFLEKSLKPAAGKRHVSETFNVPKDGVAGVYRIELTGANYHSALRAPLTDLPGEVYRMPVTRCVIYPGTLLWLGLDARHGTVQGKASALGKRLGALHVWDPAGKPCLRLPLERGGTAAISIDGAKNPGLWRLYVSGGVNVPPGMIDWQLPVESPAYFAVKKDLYFVPDK